MFIEFLFKTKKSIATPITYRAALISIVWIDVYKYGSSSICSAIKFAYLHSYVHLQSVAYSNREGRFNAQFTNVSQAESRHYNVSKYENLL